MVKDLIGYRFSPTEEELVNHYLKNKNLGNTCLVDEAISEINILSYEPECLPSLAKIQSDDPKWYFFSRIEYTNAKKNVMKRSTGSGFWKPVGMDLIIRDKDGVEIGRKKTLVYSEGKGRNGVRTPWVMHEYHITCLPQDQRTYVICQVMKKDKDGVTSIPPVVRETAIIHGCFQGITSTEAVQEDCMVGRSVGEGSVEVETKEKRV